MGGQMKYRLPLQRGAPAKIGDAPAKFRILSHRCINDYTVTPIFHAPLPQREAHLVRNLGGQLLPLLTLFRRFWLSIHFYIKARLFLKGYLKKIYINVEWSIGESTCAKVYPVNPANDLRSTGYLDRSA